MRKFQIQASSPVPFSQGFANFLVNYLHFAFQNGFCVSCFFFFELTVGCSNGDRSSRDLILDLTDATGIGQPLPTELGPLPLYQDDGGFYSVLGPPLGHPAQEDQATGSTNHALAYSPIDIPVTLTPPWEKVLCGSSKCSGNRFEPSPPAQYLYLSYRLIRSSGPHTCSRRSYTCKVPNCPRPAPFKTKQALNRHYEAIHLAQRFDCPVPGCENVGEKGIKRYDNLVAHMRNKHGYS